MCILKKTPPLSFFLWPLSGPRAFFFAAVVDAAGVCLYSGGACLWVPQLKNPRSVLNTNKHVRASDIMWL